MTKIMIIEDDYIVRLYLKNNVVWNANGFEISAEAPNGDAALGMLKSISVDVVITDMSMPGMDGITLIKKIRESYPHIKIVVLSCHDDFKLVKDAMKYGAVDYILKHTMEPGKLLETIKNAIKNDNDSEIEKLKVLKNENAGNMPYDHSALEDLLKGICSIDEKKIKDQLDKMKVNIGLRNLYVVSIDILDRGVFNNISSIEDIELYRFSVMKSIDSIMEGIQTYTSVYIDNRFVIILSFEKYKSYCQIENILRNTVAFINDSLSKTLKIKAFLGVSNLLKDITQLSLGYEQCLCVLKYRIYKVNTFYMFYSEINRNYTLTEINSRVNSFKNLLRSSNYIEGEEALKSIFNLIQQFMVSPEDLESILIEMLNIASGVAESLGLGINEVFGVDSIPYNSIKKFKNIDDIYSWNMEIFNIIKKCVVRQSAGGYRKDIRNAIEYMNKNLDKEITLNTVARQLNISAVYFSQLFKQQTGENFSEYLSKIRIEYAKKLLEGTSMKVYEVAYKSGFSQPQYFIKIFKDSVGMTPMDYRNCSSG